MAERVDYHRYMASREWALKKRAVRERSGGDCERCEHHKMAQVHHLSYQHLGNEPLEDLLGVCKWCHEYLSAVRDVDPRHTRSFEFYKSLFYEWDDGTKGFRHRDLDSLLERDIYQWIPDWKPVWQQEMETKYGNNWTIILNHDLSELGCHIFKDSEQFIALPIP